MKGLAKTVNNMTQEKKELLLKDLCARLPYGVVVLDEAARVYGKIFQVNPDFVKYDPENEDEDGLRLQTIYNVKPYLRPMSSMTEEEREELSHFENSVQRTDFFYAHHIDCRFLIEKGLAFEAPEGMYKQ